MRAFTSCCGSLLNTASQEVSPKARLTVSQSTRSHSQMVLWCSSSCAGAILMVERMVRWSEVPAKSSGRYFTRLHARSVVRDMIGRNSLYILCRYNLMQHLYKMVQYFRNADTALSSTRSCMLYICIYITWHFNCYCIHRMFHLLKYNNIISLSRM